MPKGTCSELILTPNLWRLLRLEGCLSGKVPKGAKPIPGPCTELARAATRSQFLAGPATFLNEAVIQIDEQLQRLAATCRPIGCANSSRRWRRGTASPAPQASATRNSSPRSSSTCTSARGTPKARLAYLFPNDHSTQIVLRLRPDLSDSERSEALRLIREAVYDTTPRKVCTYRGQPEPCFGLHGAGTYTITGAPVLVDGITGALKDALLILFAVAIVVMGDRLAARLPLALALAAVGDRTCRGGAHVWPARSHRWLADDRLDCDVCRS